MASSWFFLSTLNYFIYPAGTQKTEVGHTFWDKGANPALHHVIKQWQSWLLLRWAHCEKWSPCQSGVFWLPYYSVYHFLKRQSFAFPWPKPHESSNIHIILFIFRPCYIFLPSLSRSWKWPSVSSSGLFLTHFFFCVELSTVFIRDVEFVFVKKVRKDHWGSGGVVPCMLDRGVTWKYPCTLNPQRKEPTVPDICFGRSRGLLTLPGSHNYLPLSVIF